MMQSINYDLIAEKRRKNYEFLRNALGGEPLVGDVVPMIFPYLKDGGEMVRRLLIQSRIFVAKYWPNVDAWAGERAIETWMANNILPLPIDQRYGNDEMSQIVELIKTI